MGRSLSRAERNWRWLLIDVNARLQIFAGRPRRPRRFCWSGLRISWLGRDDQQLVGRSVQVVV